MSRVRAWCFTLNNPQTVEVDYLTSTYARENTTYLVFEDEKGEEGTPHIQGYVHFKNPTGLAGCKKWLKRGHFEQAKGSPQQNKTYCTKDKTNVHEYGEMPKQGKRNDIAHVKELVKQGVGMDMIVEEATSYQAMRTAELLCKYTRPKLRPAPEVLWFWGPTGTGKTRKAIEMAGEDFWISGRNLRWWDGYFGQKTVILDDLRKDCCPFNELLRILDRYPYRVETKGSSTWLLAERIIVTSPYPPEQFDNTLGMEDLKQLIRRISKSVNFNEKCTKVGEGNTEPPLPSTSHSSEKDPDE